MIKNIIFDIGNVLTDFRWAEFLKDKGYDEDMISRIADATVLSKEWHEVDRGILSQEELLCAFVKNDKEIEAEIRNAFADYHDLVTPRDYAMDWIKDLKKRGYHLYYLSNFSKKAEAECKEALAFIPYTEGGILSHYEKLIKPDAAIYELLLKRYGLDPFESVFIDDTKVNIDAAEALGIRGLWFQDAKEGMALLEEILT
ncbi:HAD family phosphatase [Lachnospiraceae bacterium OttesenSCG-928-D06]|nr:HAD family phosphatase [Lachnospiraceae bacterium OttesenSCG-928-D06]MDL2302111.1 HAD family phosphatase [Lachnospiraceae bacterium OttesenSCG-928-D06]